MSSWKHPGFELPAVAVAVGPFATADFIQVVSRFEDGTALPAASDDGFIPLSEHDGEIRFAGDADLTDYHTPFGEGCDELIARVAADEKPQRFVLDSLPEEAARPLAVGLRRAGWSVDTRVHEVAAVLDLADSFERYLEAIGKKERHEVRRKRRRYERLVGEVRHSTQRGAGWALEEFVRLHRMSRGDKGRFMTEEREQIFTELARQDGWRFDLLEVDGSAAAVVFGYSDADAYYLYNSAYDPELSDASPGVVLLGTMIEQSIGEGLSRFDFLKGDEAYKFRLGARRRPLTEIRAVPGDPG